MENTCAICGAVIPEGRRVCGACEEVVDKFNSTGCTSFIVPAVNKSDEKTTFRVTVTLENRWADSFDEIMNWLRTACENMAAGDGSFNPEIKIERF